MNNKFSKKILISISIIIIIIIMVLSVEFGLFRKKSFDESEYISKPGVHFIIKPEFEEYLLNQKIWMKIKIFNNLETPYKIIYPFHLAGLKISVKDPNNIPLHNIFTEGDLLLIDTSFIMGKDSLVKYVHLDWIFFSRYQLEKRQTGEFTISMKYQNLESNIINISISEPTGGDKEIFDKTHGAYYPFSNNDQSVNLEKLLKKNNPSPYGPQLYEQLFGFSPDRSDSIRFLGIFEECFSTYPDSYSQIEIFRDYVYYLGNEMPFDRNVFDQRLENLKARYKGRFLEECVDNYINKTKN